MEVNTKVVSFGQIKEWVAHGKTEDALDALVLKAGDFGTEASLLNARFENLKRRIIGGTISEENRNVETNSINEAILALMEEIQENKGKRKETKTQAKSGGGVLKRGVSFFGNGIKWAFILSIVMAIAIPSIIKSMKESSAAAAAAVERIEIRNSFYGGAEEVPENENIKTIYLDQGTANNNWFDIQITNVSWDDQQVVLEMKLQNYTANTDIQISAFELSDLDQDLRILLSDAEASRLGNIVLEGEEIKTLEMRFDHHIGDSKSFVLASLFKVSGIDYEEATSLAFYLTEEQN